MNGSPIAMPWRLIAVATLAFAACAALRPLDHDESQYVAAAVLSAHGYLPYRDYAYLQTPLQPVLFAPLAWAAGALAWPALRLVNAALGVGVVAGVWRAAREGGAGPGAALAAAVLLGASDILLFSIATARNDALPAACLAVALILVVRAGSGHGSTGGAMLAGLLLAAAAAAKVSYALPAATYGLYALFDRRHRPLALLAGALPVVAFVAWTYAQAPAGFVFGTLHFPSQAPAEYYLTRLWKLSLAAKAVDTLKFLALGPALLALAVLAVRRRWGAVEALVFAGAVAALLPHPTWRQYLLPMLPPLFVALALRWEQAPPRRVVRVLAVTLACAGVAPTVAAIWPSSHGSMRDAGREGTAIRAALDAARVPGPVATLSPQFIATPGRLPDARFATGPFYFRSARLLAPNVELALHVVSYARMNVLDRDPPRAILVGGEGTWTSGSDGLDLLLERWAVAHGYRRLPLTSGRFRLYVRRP